MTDCLSRLIRPGKSNTKTGAGVAQSVEQWTENPCVGGSIPSPGTTWHQGVGENMRPTPFHFWMVFQQGPAEGGKSYCIRIQRGATTVFDVVSAVMPIVPARAAFSISGRVQIALTLRVLDSSGVRIASAFRGLREVRRVRFGNCEYSRSILPRRNLRTHVGHPRLRRKLYDDSAIH